MSFDAQGAIRIVQSYYSRTIKEAAFTERDHRSKEPFLAFELLFSNSSLPSINNHKIP